MHLEVERKFRIADAAAVLPAVEMLGGVWTEPIVQLDLYLNHPGRDFARTDEALRIRRVGERNFVTYKGPKLDATSKTRRELELPLPPGAERAEQFAVLFEQLGFCRVAEVRKVRRIAEFRWQERELELALDDVVEVGLFVELETSADEADLDAARGALADLAARLGLAGDERRSYLELLLEVRMERAR